VGVEVEDVMTGAVVEVEVVTVVLVVVVVVAAAVVVVVVVVVVVPQEASNMAATSNKLSPSQIPLRFISSSIRLLI
jgi:hypothetical protein